MAEQPIGIFFSYAHADDELRDQLSKQLKILEHQQLAVSWCDRQILAGSQWANVIDERLNSANIILLLISPDFLSSDFCMKVEYPRAMERHEAGEACVIPVLLRSCPWKESIYNTLQAYPKDLIPVTSWPNRDEAWYNVTQGILAAVKSLLLANQSLLNLPKLSKPKGSSERISIRFNCANDFAGGSERAGTIAYLLIRTKVETTSSVPFEVSSETVETTEQKLRSLDSLTARTPEEEKEYRHLLRVRDGTGDRLRTFEEALRLVLDNEALRNNTFLSVEERVWQRFVRFRIMRGNKS